MTYNGEGGTTLKGHNDIYHLWGKWSPTQEQLVTVAVILALDVYDSARDHGRWGRWAVAWLAGECRSYQATNDAVQYAVGLVAPDSLSIAAALAARAMALCLWGDEVVYWTAQVVERHSKSGELLRVVGEW